MNWNATLTAPKAQISDQSTPNIAKGRHLYQYAVYTSLGAISGATGTAFAIGLAIIIQALLAPDAVFWPNVLLLALAAALFSWAASWLLGTIADWTIPSFIKHGVVKYRLPILLATGTVVSLIQTFLFVAVL